MFKPKKNIYEEASSLLPEEELQALLPEESKLPASPQPIESPTTPEQSILDLYRQQMQKMEEDTSRARMMDEVSSLVNTLSPALSGRAQARAITSAGSLGGDPGPSKVNLKTNRAEEARSSSKDRLQALLDQYKLTSQLQGKKSEPKVMKVGDRVIQVSPTGEAKELYKPSLSEEEIKDKDLSRQFKEKQIQQLDKQINLTPEQKEAAQLDLEFKRANLEKAKKALIEDPEKTSMEKQKGLLEIEKLKVQNQTAQRNLDDKDKPEPLNELDQAKIEESKAKASLTKAQADKLNKPQSSNIFEKKKMEKLAGAGVEYITKDRDQLVSNVEKIDVALDLIDKAPSGDVSGPYRGLAPDMFRSITNPEAIIVKESMQSAIQETLRPTLGAQFTEKEGERIMNLAYNDTLPPEENKRRANALKEFIQKKVKFSDDLYRYLDENGSDKGFPYENYGMNKQGSTTGAEAPQGDIVERNGKTYKWNAAKGKYQLI